MFCRCRGNMICRSKVQSHSSLYYFKPSQPLTLKPLPGEVIKDCEGSGLEALGWRLELGRCGFTGKSL